MTQDWARLGAAVRHARKAAGFTQNGLAQATGLGRATIQAVERGHAYTKIQPTHRVIAQTVGWTEESVKQVLAGGDPETVKPASLHPSGDTRPAKAAPSSLDLDLPLRIVQEIEEGPLLDAQVIDLSPLGSSARMIVVVKGAPNASPEEIRRDLLAWRRAQGVLEDLEEPPADGDDTSSAGA